MLPKPIYTIGMLASLLAPCLGATAAAQVIPEPERFRLISRDEGEAVVQAAWELRRSMNPKPDCSHFVHAVYARAGLDYEYASAGDVFDGIDSFQRVQNPQAGDLVVWPGHIGIVVDREEHSFYSAVRSGFAIEDYLSVYWTARGRPRFYRYRINAAQTRLRERRFSGFGTGLAAPSAKQSTGSIDRITTDSDPRSLDDPAHDPSPDADRKTAPIAKSPASKLAPGDATAFDLVFVSRRNRPSKDEVRAAIIKLADAGGERLLSGAALDSQPRVVVLDVLTVIKIDIRERAGWAELEVREKASIQHGKAGLNQMTDRWRVTLRRDAEGWVLLWPQDRIYLQRDLAIKVLANHLATTNANTQDLRRIVKVLDQLLAEKNAFAPSVGSSN